MKRPEFLKKNGKIGYVAPSFGCNIEPYRKGFDTALKKIQNMGYENVIGPNAYAGEGIGISNTPEKCGEELNDFYLNKDVDLIMSCGGGELMCEILDFVDFEAMKTATPKWYVGYSDNTNFTFPLATLSDTMSVYGPCAPSFGPEWHQCHYDFFEIITGRKDEVSGYDMWELESLKNEENPLVTYNLTEKNVSKAYYGDKFEGRLLGGCLDCLVNICGTGFDNVCEFNNKYGDEGIIWFLESCDLNVFSIRRALWELKHAGWFEKVSGFIIGRPLQFNEEIMGLNRINAVLDMLESFKVPIIMDADIGHLPPSMPIITGCYANVVFENDRLTIKYDFDR